MPGAGDREPSPVSQRPERRIDETRRNKKNKKKNRYDS